MTATETTTAPPQHDTRPITMPFWAFERFLTLIAAGKWNAVDHPELGEAWDILVAAKDEALGHEPAAPAPASLPPVLEIRSQDGLLVAELGPTPDGRFVVHLPVAYDAAPALPVSPGTRLGALPAAAPLEVSPDWAGPVHWQDGDGPADGFGAEADREDPR